MNTLSQLFQVKTNSKPWFDNEIILAIQRRNKLYKEINSSGLETDKDNFKAAKTHLKKIMLYKKKTYFEDVLAKNKKNQENFGRL